MENKKCETLTDRIQEAPFPRLGGKKELIDIAVFESFNLELWSDGSVTWVRSKQPKEKS
jgi:hypothetical protein